MTICADFIVDVTTCAPPRRIEWMNGRLMVTYIRLLWDWAGGTWRNLLLNSPATTRPRRVRNNILRRGTYQTGASRAHPYVYQLPSTERRNEVKPVGRNSEVRQLPPREECLPSPGQSYGALSRLSEHRSSNPYSKIPHPGIRKRSPQESAGALGGPEPLGPSVDNERGRGTRLLCHGKTVDGNCV